jgi:acetylornithine deacetylase/succinyl-diaminopimelate desuccinylase-like protein
VTGKPAHVGLRHTGVNAVERAFPLLRSLFDLESEVRQRSTSFRIHPEEARRSILLVGGRCEGGTGFNVVPGSFRFTLDRRFNPEESLAEEKERLIGLIDGFRRSGVDLEVKVLQEGSSAASPEDHALARALASSVKAITGRVPSFELCPGLLENRFYTDLGVPAYAYGPGLLAVSHGPNEFVKLKEIEACTAVYALTAARLLTNPGA